jgi:hypothetical protein
MHEYVERARAALTGFGDALAALQQAAAGDASRARLPTRQRDRFADITERLRAALARLEHSLAQVSGDTALDVVDLQVRMEGEGAALASALTALGELVEESPVLLEDAANRLQLLEEGAERVAAALFPNAIDGVADINRTLWQFRPIWNEYAHALAREVARTGAGRLTSDQIARVERTANQVRERFDAVNELLNHLVVGQVADARSVERIIREAKQALSAAIREAKSKAAAAYAPFHAVLRRAESLARRIDDQFGRLRVPVFPAADGLDELTPLVEGVRYADLAGVERFALLNISARIRSIPLAEDGSRHLMAPQFSIRVFDVFPDRIYFTADASFISAVQALQAARVFEEASASLHRFREGSFKQRQSRRGNLQLSYAIGTPGEPHDRTRVSVDADIDLYRSSVRHLFGEVLVNHLTGRRTDQFRVWDTLASSAVRPIGGFAIVSG